MTDDRLPHAANTPPQTGRSPHAANTPPQTGRSPQHASVPGVVPDDARRAAELPPWTVRLPEDASAPRVAREALGEWLRDADASVRHDAQSVVSELVSAAVRQGAPPIELLVEQRGERMRVAVADAGAPGTRRPPQDWSQRIIDELAARWGVRGDDAHVWFELPLGSMQDQHSI